MAATLSSQTSSIDEVSVLIFQKCALYRLVETLRSETWTRIDQCRKSSAHAIVSEALLRSSGLRCSGEVATAAQDAGSEAAPHAFPQASHQQEALLPQQEGQKGHRAILSQERNEQEQQQQHHEDVQDMHCQEAQQLIHNGQTVQELELLSPHSPDSEGRASCDHVDEANLLASLLDEALTAASPEFLLLQSHRAVLMGLRKCHAVPTSRQPSQIAYRNPGGPNESVDFVTDGGAGGKDLTSAAPSVAAQGAGAAARLAAAGKQSATSSTQLHWIREALILLRRVDDPQHVQLQRRKKSATAPVTHGTAPSPDPKTGLAPAAEDANAAAPTSMVFGTGPSGSCPAVPQRSSRTLYAQWVGPGGGPWGGRSDTWHHHKRRFLAGAATAHSAIATQMFGKQVGLAAFLQATEQLTAAEQQNQAKFPPASLVPYSEVDEEDKGHEAVVNATDVTGDEFQYVSEVGAAASSNATPPKEVFSAPLAADASALGCDFCPLRAEMLVLVLSQHLRRSDKHLSIFCNSSALLVEARNQAFDSVLADAETTKALTCARGSFSRNLTIEDALASYMDLQLRRHVAVGLRGIEDNSDDTWMEGVARICSRLPSSENFLKAYARLLALRLLPDWMTAGMNESKGCNHVGRLRRAPLHVRLERARAAAGCPGGAFEAFLDSSNSNGSEQDISADLFSEGAAIVCAVEAKTWDTLQRTFEARCPVPPEEQWRIRQALADIAAARDTMLVYRRQLQHQTDHALPDVSDAPQLSAAANLIASDCQQAQQNTGCAAESAVDFICPRSDESVHSKGPGRNNINKDAFEALVLTKNAWEMHLPAGALNVTALPENFQSLLGQFSERPRNVDGLKIPQQLYVHLEVRAHPYAHSRKVSFCSNALQWLSSILLYCHVLVTVILVVAASCTFGMHLQAGTSRWTWV
ncbi:hypothetical protein ACSSS7_003647 [Eimeria intestinalis]